MSNESLCLAIGTAIRESEVSGIGSYPELQDLVKKEATRRRLLIDYALVSASKIRLGISECQLLASWGEPESRNRSVGPWGEHIQHVYAGQSFVYTENGRVKSWQN